MDVTTRAVATAVLAALVAAAAFVGELPLVVLAVLLAGTLSLGWPVLLDLPGRHGASTVIALGGVGAVLAVAITRGEPFLRDLPVILALAVLLAFVNELLRGNGRERVVESVSGVVSGVLLAAVAAAWVAAGRTVGGVPLVVTGAVALAVGSAISALPPVGWLGALMTLAAAAGAGVGVSAAVPDLGLLPGGIIGLAVGILIAALRALFDRLPALERRSAGIAAAVLPIAVSGVVVYVVGRVLVG